MSTITNWEKLPQVLNVTDVSLLFDVEPVTIRRWIYNGNIESTKIGKMHFFDKDYIKAIIEKPIKEKELCHLTTI